jgi:sulfatase modifying factor 1
MAQSVTHVSGTFCHPCLGPLNRRSSRLCRWVRHFAQAGFSTCVPGLAFCDFAGLRLPTEAEWEKAARGGLAHKRFPWANELEPASGHRHNVWRGVFPTLNTTEDTYAGTCPADAFPPNGFGLHNMTGNVWEWCSDWFDKPPETRLPPRDPRGPETGGEKVVRGGSHLCHASYRERYHVHSRTKNTPDSSTGHMGFRVAADI